MQNNFTITESDISEALKVIAAELDAGTHFLDELIVGAIDHYREAIENKHLPLDKIPRIVQYRAIARYTFLQGYTSAMADLKALIDDDNARTTD